MELTIGILSFNTKQLLYRCLSSISKYTRDISFEVVVVDNASRDGSARMVKKDFPEVRLIENRINKFYAAGYNQIIKVASGRYFIMLNSDTFLENNSFKKIVDFMKKNKLSACEGLEINPDGKVIATGSRFRTPLSDFYELSILGKHIKNEKYLRNIRMKKFNRRKNFEVDVGCNAYFCINTELMKRIGFYDESFILYYTEDDMSKKIKALGEKIYHCAESYVVHDEAKSTTLLGWERINIFYRDLLNYHLKYSNPVNAYLLYYLLNVEKILWKLVRKTELG